MTANPHRPESTIYPVRDDELFNEQCIRRDAVWEARRLQDDWLKMLADLVGRGMGQRGPVEFVSKAQGSFNVVLAVPHR